MAASVFRAELRRARDSRFFFIEEMMLHTFSCSLLFVAGLLVVVSFGCSREAPVEKVKAPAASGNAVMEAVGEAAVGYIKTPMDKARQTEGTLEQSAEQRGSEIEKATR